MILLSHPTGNANVRNTAVALAENDLLAEFWTSISWNTKAAFNRWLPPTVRALLGRRAFPDVLRNQTRQTPWREAGRILSKQLGLSFLTRHETGPFSVDAVYGSLDSKVARRVERGKGLKAVYAYEDGARATFAAASKKGVRCFYDLPIGYWRAGQEIYREEVERVPEWESTLMGIRNSDAKLARKDEELALANVVVVASTFTRTTLTKAPPFSAKVHVIPYGAAPLASDQGPRGPADSQKLKVLFAGALTQRKGLSYLLEAVALLGPRVTLTLLGSKVGPGCPAVDAATRKHRWIPSLPHEQMLQEMSNHDVVVLPSLFEGFGLVILEAMAQGTPVITTPHTAGPDIIEDGIDGFIVPIRSASAIAERLEQFLGRIEFRAAMSAAAEEKASLHSWAAYRSNLAGMFKAELEKAY